MRGRDAGGWSGGLGGGLVAIIVTGCATGAEPTEGPLTFGDPQTTTNAATSSTPADTGDTPTSTGTGSMEATGDSTGGSNPTSGGTSDTTSGVAESGSSGGAPATCGNGIVEGDEACDDMGESPRCNADCTPAMCGDAIVNAAALEECDDGGETATCDADCTMAMCGDMVVNAAAAEACDDGNGDDGDACIACQAASCGDGFLYAGVEDCDDGNLTDLDGCTNACAYGSILVSGNANTYLTQGLSAIGEAHSSNANEWATPLSAGVIIMGRDGGSAAAVSYQAHLDAGAHVLMVGGSSLTEFGTWINNYVTSSGNLGWHQSSACVSDFNVGPAHPITAYLPAAYEFSNQSVSYHMVHFLAAGQPANTDLLATSCEAGPDNYLLVTRRYPSGGTFTYLASDAGNYTGAGVDTGFVQPFLQGYLEYVRSPVP